MRGLGPLCAAKPKGISPHLNRKSFRSVDQQEKLQLITPSEAAVQNIYALGKNSPFNLKHSNAHGINLERLLLSYKLDYGEAIGEAKRVSDALSIQRSQSTFERLGNLQKHRDGKLSTRHKD